MHHSVLCSNIPVRHPGFCHVKSGISTVRIEIIVICSREGLTRHESAFEDGDVLVVVVTIHIKEGAAVVSIGGDRLDGFALQIGRSIDTRVRSSASPESTVLDPSKVALIIGDPLLLESIVHQAVGNDLTRQVCIHRLRTRQSLLLEKNCKGGIMRRKQCPVAGR